MEEIHKVRDILIFYWYNPWQKSAFGSYEFSSKYLFHSSAYCIMGAL